MKPRFSFFAAVWTFVRPILILFPIAMQGAVIDEAMGAMAMAVLPAVTGVVLWYLLHLYPERLEVYFLPLISTSALSVAGGIALLIILAINGHESALVFSFLATAISIDGVIFMELLRRHRYDCVEGDK
jgi:hypothetical protein